MEEQNNWLTICGESDQALQETLRSMTAGRVAARLYDLECQTGIKKMSLAPVKGELSLSKEQLEKLRRLCQVWDVEIKTTNITSHRPVIGPLIVTLKRLIFPLLRVLLKDFVDQQREFNANCIALLADLASRQKKD